MKSQRAYQILVVFVLILPVTIFSQQQMPLFAQKTPHILNASGNFKAKENQRNDHAIGPFFNNRTTQPLTSHPFFLRVEVVGANFTLQSLPYFCKKEFLFEKNTSIPLRMRLGSLDYVNRLEGKENHWSMVPGN